MATIEMWLDKGIARVILGTVAVENPDLVREAARAFPGKVAVGLDARGGFVATKGWAEQTDIAVTDLARAFEDAGVAAIIYTDIDRDGAMQGPNVPATEALARATSIPGDRLGRRLLPRRPHGAARHGRHRGRDLGPRAL
jgi:phosphoribosylformimino-5-aminoimidazole carboxamide ribotide isomerase